MTPGTPSRHDRLVVAGFAPSPGLPAVVDLTTVPEGGRLIARRPWADQIVLSANVSSFAQITAPPSDATPGPAAT